MARQLILLVCLVAVVSSAVLNCYWVGPRRMGECGASSYRPIGDSCYACSQAPLPSTCTQVGPVMPSGCPSNDLIIQYGLGQSVDPFGVGICTRCPK